jgi:hypothetical protein
MQVYAAFPGLLTWVSNNLAGPWKRAVGMALQIGIGNFGGIGVYNLKSISANLPLSWLTSLLLVGSNIYLSSQAPTYPVGYGVLFGFLAINGIGGGLLNRYLLEKEQRRRDKLTPEEINAMYTPEQLAAMGDRAPTFRYTM